MSLPLSYKFDQLKLELPCQIVYLSNQFTQSKLVVLFDIQVDGSQKPDFFLIT